MIWPQSIHVSCFQARLEPFMSLGTASESISCMSVPGLAEPELVFPCSSPHGAVFDAGSCRVLIAHWCCGYC